MIGKWYLNYVSQSKFTPRLVRSNRGSENLIIAGLQRYYLRSTNFANSSLKVGSSTANQRIESWWSVMRRSRLNWWIKFFKDPRDQGHFDATNAYHVHALRFSFIRVGWNSRAMEKPPYTRGSKLQMSCRPPRSSVPFDTHSKCTKLWFWCQWTWR